MKRWEVGKRVRMYGEYWYIVGFSRGNWILQSITCTETIEVPEE